jgi:hypothetical protein
LVEALRAAAAVHAAAASSNMRYPQVSGLSQLTGDVTQRSHLFGVQ